MFKPQKLQPGYGARVFIFILILAANIVSTIVHDPLGAYGYHSWVLFTTSVAFFLQEEGTPLFRIIRIAVSAIAGLLLGAGTIIMVGWLTPTLGHYSKLVPITIALVLIILIGPIFPNVLNSVSFLFYIESTIVSETTVPHLGANILTVLVASVILNGGAAWISAKYRARLAAKMDAMKCDG